VRRELYKRWRNHPLRHLLREVENDPEGRHIYPDELDDLNLPPKVRKAAEAAIARCRKPGSASSAMGGQADHLSAALVDALPAHHETREVHQRRRADAGDVDAIQAVEARKEAIERQAAEIKRRASGGVVQ
jgi:hypothetical protein